MQRVREMRSIPEAEERKEVCDGSVQTREILEEGYFVAKECYQLSETEHYILSYIYLISYLPFILAII